MVDYKNIENKLIEIIGKKFIDDTIIHIEKIIGKELFIYEQAMDYELDDDEKDEYMNVSSYTNQDEDFIIKIYYGNKTLNIFDINYYNTLKLN